MAYKVNGEWLPGTPPRGTSDAVYLNSQNDLPSAAELREAELPAAELADVRPGVAWMTETQACIALGVAPAVLYDDPQLVGSAVLEPGLGIVFDAAVVARRIAKPKGEDASVADQADALLDEMRNQPGLELGGLDGGT